MKWKDNDVFTYIEKHNEKLPPAYHTLGISGDCLCGAFAKEEERPILKTLYPEVFKRIRNLEIEKKEKWGHRSIRTAYQQQELDEIITDPGLIYGCGGSCPIKQIREAEAIR